MEGWIAGVVIAVAIVLVWWVFKPSKKPTTAADERPGSGMRLAERGLDAVARGLKIAVEDESLVDRFDFPPFGRGVNRAATEVLTGQLGGDDIVAFRYSFALDGEPKRREFDITVVSADFPWSGRLRLTSLPRARGSSPDFADVWRVDEEPPGTSLLGPGAQHLLLHDRLKASAIVAQNDALVLIDVAREDNPDLDGDVLLLRRLREALLAA